MTVKIPVRLGRSKPVIQVKESDIQRLILDWLAAERIWHIRLNTGAFGGVHNGKRRFVRFGRPGMADILAVKASYNHATMAGAPIGIPTVATWHRFTVTTIGAGQAFPIPAYWIEVKTAKGTQSDEQKRFQKEITEQGMTYILARSLEDVTAVLK